MNIKRPSLSANQQGIVSIMVVSILVILISLVTIGFARLMNRETREALDKQLGVQSYYAAESGVNDAISYINQKKGSGDIKDADLTTCDDSRSKLNFNLSDATEKGNAQYSCVLIDTEPAALIYNIKAGQSKVFSFDQEKLASILISWQKDGTSPSDNYRPVGKRDFTPVSAWVDSAGRPATGALKVSIYPVMLQYNTGGSSGNPPVPLDDRVLTARNARTFFLYPDQVASADKNKRITPVDYHDNNGAIISGQCDDSHKSIDHAAVNYPGPRGNPTYRCNSILNCLPDSYDGPGGSASLSTNQVNPDQEDPRHPPPFGCLRHIQGFRGQEYRAEHYVVKVTSLYSDTVVSLMGAQSVRLDPVALVGAQAAIDSTGKGNDVLRRISARVPLTLNGSGEIGSDFKGPEAGLRTAETVCKRIRQLTTGSVTVDDSSGGSDSAACTEGISP
ncbi:hypothetical protein HY857_01745 [Candidatus Saccharibacteria bacterium]|nr:hypothetical protein [Candidatus Saccharibacteria bacterium]